MNTLQAIILAIVEGLTEFLPVSSTGHMIITSSLMGIAKNDFVKVFTIAIQFGAILSVLALYWRKFLQSIDIYLKLFVAFLPAAIIGFLLNDYIDALLENVIVVAIMLVVGGIVLIFIDRWFTHETNQRTFVRYPAALRIGLFQTIAMVPGVSRSAATIIGGLTQGLTRQTAAEFSFLLAVPTMLAATAYKMYKYQKEFGFKIEDLGTLAVGNVVAFVVAIIAIKGFVGYLNRNGFKVFGYYRIFVGILIIVLYLLGFSLEIV